MTIRITQIEEGSGWLEIRQKTGYRGWECPDRRPASSERYSDVEFIRHSGWRRISARILQ